jgi:hypothetical protein
VFKHALKKKKFEESIRESTLLDFQDYKIFLRDGEYIRVALITKSDPSESLKINLREYISQFEIEHNADLKNFLGELTPFDNYLTLINKYFKLYIRSPLKVSKSPPHIKINSFQKILLNTANFLEKDYKSFSFEKLLESTITLLPKESEEKIISNIYNLIELEFIISNV